MSCKNGPNIDDEVKEGARVRSIEEGKSQVTSHVVGVGFVKKAKHEGEENDNFQTDAFCVRLWFDQFLLDIDISFVKCFSYFQNIVTLLYNMSAKSFIYIKGKAHTRNE